MSNQGEPKIKPDAYCATDEKNSYDNAAYELSKSQNVDQLDKILAIACTNIADKKDNCNNVDSRIRRQNSVIQDQQSTEQNCKFSDDPEKHRSRWYQFCIKYRAKSVQPSWQPTYWSTFCPFPYCPTYRQCSRLIGLTIIGVFLWCVVYSVTGPTAAPGGQLFQLIVLTVCAYIGGWLVTLVNMPALIGMLSTGILFQNVGLVHFEEEFSAVTSQLRKIALVVILVRAGLSLDPVALKRLKWTAIKLGLIPWASELPIIAVTTHYFLGLPWLWAFLLGSVIAAVSPAVVVPCLFRLRLKGYGVAKGIPTLIIAAAGMDDAISVAAFGILKSVIFSNDSLAVQILQGPLSIICGIAFGIVWGLLSNYIPEKTDPFVTPLRVLMLSIGGLFPVFVSELLGYSGAGPLAVVTAAFVSLIVWSSPFNGWSNTRNPASVAFELFWMVFEPVLFGLTGAQVRVQLLDGHVVALACGCIAASLAVRCAVTMLVGVGCGLNLREKAFVAVTWMSKATVQAALGPVILGIVGPDSPMTKDAEIILTVCILSILLTAPTGAILITLLGPKLLTKTVTPTDADLINKRIPSMHDLTITNDMNMEYVNSENGDVKSDLTIYAIDSGDKDKGPI